VRHTRPILLCVLLQRPTSIIEREDGLRGHGAKPRRDPGLESLVGIKAHPLITGLWGGYPEAEQYSQLSL